jgi:DNA replication protein DnaC
MLKPTWPTLRCRAYRTTSSASDKLSKYQQVPIDLLKYGKEKIIYITGKAGTGKTNITALTALNFRAPTVHTMFGWSHFNTLNINMNPTKLDELRRLYAGVKCFVIDEVRL